MATALVNRQVLVSEPRSGLRLTAQTSCLPCSAPFAGVRCAEKCPKEFDVGLPQKLPDFCGVDRLARFYYLRKLYENTV